MLNYFEKFMVHFKQISYQKKKVKCKIEIEKISGEIIDLIDSIPNLDEDDKMKLYRKIEQLEEKFGEFAVYGYILKKMNGFFN